MGPRLRSSLGRLVRRLCLVTALVVTAACGSTVQHGAGTDAVAGVAAADQQGAGLEVPGGAAAPTRDGGTSGASTPAGGTSSSGARGSAAGSSSGTSGSAGTTGSAGGTQPGSSQGGDAGAAGGGPAGPSAGAPDGSAVPAPGATGRGFDETTINIGVGAGDESGGAVLEGLGIQGGETTIDFEAAAQAVIDDINATGGIGGRQINLVEHQLNTAEVLTSPSTAAQAACATWTEDNEVFAVTLSGLAFPDELIRCLAQRDTPFLWQGGSEAPARNYQSYYDAHPLYFNIGGMVGELYNEVAIRRLVARDFFQPWDTLTGGPASGPTASPMKLGIIIFGEDERANRRLEHLTAELAKYDIEFSAVFRSGDSIDSAATEASSQVLQFRSEGITHVFGAGLFFLQAAESQGYRPRYFFEQALNVLALSAPAGQLVGSMGESYIPAGDTNESTYPGSPSPAYDHCLEVIGRAGVSPSSNLDHLSMQQLCDGFYPLRDAIAASGVLSNQGLIDGFAALGDRPVSAITWTSQYTLTRHASTIALRDLSFDPACTCFAYDSDVNHF